MLLFKLNCSNRINRIKTNVNCCISTGRFYELFCPKNYVTIKIKHSFCHTKMVRHQNKTDFKLKNTQQPQINQSYKSIPIRILFFLVFQIENVHAVSFFFYYSRFSLHTVLILTLLLVAGVIYIIYFFYLFILFHIKYLFCFCNVWWWHTFSSAVNLVFIRKFILNYILFGKQLLSRMELTFCVFLPLSVLLQFFFRVELLFFFVLLDKNRLSSCFYAHRTDTKRKAE